MLGRIKGKSGNRWMLEIQGNIDFPLDTDIDITIKKHAEKRSLNANAYFHVLCDKLRLKLNMSMAECKNHLITSYGQIEYIDDVPVTYKTNAPPEWMIQQEYIHMKQISVQDSEGAYWYRVYRGSHTYNSQEMAKLIDGTVEECKLQGIETLTPAELARLEGYEKQSYKV